MKSLYYSVLFLALVMISCTKESKKSDRETDGLRGDVRSVFSIAYEAIDKLGEGEIVKGTPKTYGSEYVTYDSLGNILEKRKICISECIKEAQIKYNSQGKIVRSTYFDEKGENVESENEYQHDEKGHVCSRINLTYNKKNAIKNLYNELGLLIYSEDDISKDQYIYDSKGRNIEKTFIYKNPLRSGTTKFEFDANGNKIKTSIKYVTGEVIYWFYKYDNQNRLIDEIKTHTEEIDKNEIEVRYQHFYRDEKTLQPNRSIIWNKNGQIEKEKYQFWFYLDTDTLSQISLDQNFCINNLENDFKQQDGIIKTTYKIKSEIYKKETYNYSNKKLQSIVDKEGNISSFEYDGDDLKTVTQQLPDGMSKSIFNNGQVVSITKYDMNKNIVSTENYEYKGNQNNGTQTIRITDSEKKSKVFELTIQEGKTINTKSTINDLTVDIQFSYNETGNIESIINPTGPKITYKYKYDSLGNWIQKTSFSDGKPEKITERVIEYF